MILSAGSDPLAYLGSGEIKAIIWATGYRPDYSVLDRKGRIQHDGGVLDALLTDRSVSKAAERVHISQSAMSDALARLREYFQTKCLLQSHPAHVREALQRPSRGGSCRVGQ
jgi:hypothetical protein